MSYIPPIYQERIRVAHEKGRNVLTAHGIDSQYIEPVDVALAVEEHRWTWKPDNVKTALIAESHVYTSSEDFEYRISVSSLPSDASHVPSEYVRLIYCLGYGEKEILTNDGPKNNSGTPQFWKIFGSIAGKLPMPPKSYKTPSSDRIRWKIDTLKKLQSTGVWLLDASLHGIYLGGGETLPRKAVLELHRIWWEEYGSSILEEIKPKKVWFIGKGVHDVVSKFNFESDGWIYQPRAMISNEKWEKQFNLLLESFSNRVVMRKEGRREVRWEAGCYSAP